MVELLETAPFGKDCFPGQDEVDQKSRHIANHDGNVVGYAKIDQHGVDDIVHSRGDGTYNEKLSYHFGQTTAPRRLDFCHFAQ